MIVGAGHIAQPLSRIGALLGFRVTVNPDNRLQSGTSLTRELALLSEAFGYDLDDLEGFQLNAAACAFLPLDDREELAELIQDGFDEA